MDRTQACGAWNRSSNLLGGTGEVFVPSQMTLFRKERKQGQKPTGDSTMSKASRRASHKSVNRCFPGNQPAQNPKAEEEIKELLTAKRQRELAQKTINRLSSEYHYNLLDLLTMVGVQARSGRISLYVFEYLIERVDQQRGRQVESFDKSGKTAKLEEAKLLLAQLKK